MRFVVAAGTPSEARSWAHRNRVRPCDMLVVLASFAEPAAQLAALAPAASLYGVPVVRLLGWHLKAPRAARADLEQFLADLRPPLLQVV